MRWHPTTDYDLEWPSWCPNNPDPDVQGSYPTVSTDHSMARQWNDMLLESIRADFASDLGHSSISPRS